MSHGGPRPGAGRKAWPSKVRFTPEVEEDLFAAINAAALAERQRGLMRGRGGILREAIESLLGSLEAPGAEPLGLPPLPKGSGRVIGGLNLTEELHGRLGAAVRAGLASSRTEIVRAAIRRLVDS